MRDVTHTAENGTIPFGGYPRVESTVNKGKGRSAMKKGTWFGKSMGLVAVVVTLAAAGCGSGSSSSAASLCSETIQASCDKLFSCAEASDMAKSDSGGSNAQCVTTMQIFCTGASSGTCPSGKSYHADKAQQCADETKNATCAASFDSTGYLKAPDACSQVCS
jgi:hypothetical protein